MDHSLSPAEVRRYSRQITLPQVGLAGQERLAQARVLCLGAGGLGAPVLTYLAAAGVGTLGIADFDVVEESNLARQVIHREGSVGKWKTESARETIAAINPHVTVREHRVQVTSENALDLFSQYDLVVDGTDNFPTRYLANDACVLLGMPYVWGSISQFNGQVSVFGQLDGPCYRCLFPSPPPPGAVPSCAEGGVMGPLCANVGAAQAMEAIKLILGMGETLAGKIWFIDMFNAETKTLRVQPDPECSLCGENPTLLTLIDYDEFCGVPTMTQQPAAMSPAEAASIDLAARTEVTVQELAALLTAREQNLVQFQLVDVREPFETEIANIPGGDLIPQGEFATDAGAEQLNMDQPVLFFCRSGGRSGQVADALRAKGIGPVINVTGGVLAWGKEIDPSQPAY